MRQKSRLFWIEAWLAGVTGLLTSITLVFPDWIEAVSGWDPDQHSGSVEWMIVAGLFAVTVALAAAAAIEWRRDPAAGSV